MSDNDEKLDRLLSAPLAAVPDNGFSAVVVAKVAAIGTHESWVESVVLAVTACTLVAALPTAGISDWMGRVGVSLATSLPLAIAGLALAITWSYTRVQAD